MSAIPLFTILVIAVAVLNFQQSTSSTSIADISISPSIEEDENSFIAIPHYHGIAELSIRNNSLLPGIKYSKSLYSDSSLTFDWTRQKFFHLYKAVIRIVPFNPTNNPFPSELESVKTVKMKPCAIYFEHVERYLYVFYDYDKTITRFDPYIGDEGKNIVLKLGESDVMHHLVVDPCESMMYWKNTDTSNRGIIQRASTTGLNENIETIVGESQTRRFISLTIDPFKRELYWSSSGGELGRIVKSDLEGRNRVIIAENGGAQYKPYAGIGVTKEFIYYRVDWSKNIYRVKKSERNGTVTAVKTDLSSGFAHDFVLYVSRQIESRHQCVWRPNLHRFNNQIAKEKFTFGVGQRNRSLSCVFTMDLETNVKWLHNDKNMDSEEVKIHTIESLPGEKSESRMTFERMRQTDEGNYTCQVSNRNFEESVHFVVEICSSCVPKIDKSESRMVFPEGTRAQVLTCKYDITSKPNVTWTHNGQTVLESLSKYNETIGESLIRFRKINLDDGGIYTCSAVNEFGKDFFEINVNVIKTTNDTTYTYANENAGGNEIIIVLAGAGIVTLVLTFILGFLWRKHIVQKRIILRLTDGEVKEFFEGKPEAQVSNSNDCGNTTALTMPFDQNNEMSVENLLIENGAPLGEGQFGLVFRGSYQNRAVAVKTVKPNSDVAYLKGLLSEIKIMAFIGNHKGIVEFIGAHTSKITENVVYLVVELSPIGDLHSYLQRNRSQYLKYFEKVTENIDQRLNCAMSQKHFVQWSKQIADGMEYLEERKVVHADLATRNVLMFPNDVVKISDFGLSRQLYGYTTYVKKSKSPLPFRWMAPESIRFMEFSSQSDVWSFGVTIWEIFSLGQVPYPEFNWSARFVQLLVQGLRLSKPDHATVEIYGEMLKCWDPDPQKRATFEQLVDFFQSIIHQPVRPKSDAPPCEGRYIESEDVLADNIDASGIAYQLSASLDRCLVFTDDSESSVEFGENPVSYLSF